MFQIIFYRTFSLLNKDQQHAWPKLPSVNLDEWMLIFFNFSLILYN